jgi:HD-GYP domain-containing protein (c-di-GMP phosphodiesterase class II)
MSIQKEKVLINKIEFGMFISELDRPWLESPFLLQGFVLDSEAQMNALKNLCEFVYVDRTKSTGDQFGAREKINVAVTRNVSINRITQSTKIGQLSKTKPVIVVKTKNNQKKTIKETSFFEIMNAIKKGDVSHTSDGVIFNVRTEIENSKATESEIKNQEKAKQQQSSGSLGFLKSLFGNKEKLKSNVKFENTKQDSATKTDLNDQEKFKVSIYEDEIPRVEQEIAVIYPTFEKSQIATKAIFEALANEQKLDISTISDALDNMVDSISRTPDALMWLAKLKDIDNSAYGQALNVSINMMAFSSFLALPKQQIKEMGLGGLLQDIGKVKIPQRILLKPTRLNNKELEIAKLHVEEGLKILNNTDDIPLLTLDVVGNHHERFDGTGYPNRTVGSKISINAQIAGLIDTYCAMTSDRAYANGLHNQDALDAIHKMRDITFSNDLIDQLIQFLGIYPVSSLVELNTGEIGVVIQQNQVRRLQPRIMIVLTPEKIKYTSPITIDLLTFPSTPMGEPYKIIKGIPSDSFGLNLDSFFN